MMENWNTGDLALCIHGGNWDPRGTRAPDQCPAIISSLFPQRGTVWQVQQAHIVASDEWLEDEMVYLDLAGQPSPYLYDARHFQKVGRVTDNEQWATAEQPVVVHLEGLE